MEDFNALGMSIEVIPELSTPDRPLHFDAACLSTRVGIGAIFTLYKRDRYSWLESLGLPREEVRHQFCRYSLRNPLVMRLERRSQVEGFLRSLSPDFADTVIAVAQDMVGIYSTVYRYDTKHHLKELENGRSSQEEE